MVVGGFLGKGTGLLKTGRRKWERCTGEKRGRVPTGNPWLVKYIGASLKIRG